jgi:hypothetical protein
VISARVLSFVCYLLWPKYTIAAEIVAGTPEDNNVTAMMALSRNYAIQTQNLDRAVMLAEQARDLIDKMKSQSRPVQFTDAQWSEYLHAPKERREVFSLMPEP